MEKHEVEIFEDISKSLHHMVLALTYSYEHPSEVRSIAESLSLIAESLSLVEEHLSDLTMELEDIKEIMSKDEPELECPKDDTNMTENNVITPVTDEQLRLLQRAMKKRNSLTEDELDSLANSVKDNSFALKLIEEWAEINGIKKKYIN